MGWTLPFRFLAGATALWLALCGPAAAADLKGVRFGVTNAEATRIVFDVAGPIDYQLSGSEEGAGRITVILKGVSASATNAAGQGHVSRYDVSASGGQSRAVFDLGRTAKVKSHFVLPPGGGVNSHRLVIDLETANKSAFLASLPRAQPAAASLPQYTDLTQILKAVTQPTLAAKPEPAPAPAPVKQPAVRLPVIVIDPGHGGSDPGASAPRGVTEKTITLAAAKRLSEILQQRGRYHVVLTRADDTRLSTDERAKVAREAGADLFISLHADAHPDPKVRGGSIYTISDEGTQRSANEAKTKGESQVYALDLKEFSPDVSGILFNKAQAFTRTESAAFAQILLDRIKGSIPLVNNSHRQANLRVLLAPDVPAVLFELAYMSNTADVANLTLPAWRDRTMTAVAQSIDRYFEDRLASRHASAAAAAADF